MTELIRILHIDDNSLDRELVYDTLVKEGNEFAVTGLSSWDECKQRLDTEEFDLVLTDYNIAGVDGLQVIHHIKQIKPDLPVIVLTGTGSEEVAAESMKKGAADYVLKTVRDIRHLSNTITTVIEYNRAERELAFKNTILAAQQETAIEGMVVINHDDKIISWNNRFLEIWGIPLAVIESGLNKRALEIALPKLKTPEEFLARVRYLTDHPEEKSFDEIELNDGRTLERYSTPLIADNNVNYGRIWYFRDITERKNIEIKLLRQNRVLGVLSAINSLIVRVKDSDQLFSEACRIAVETGQFRMAWIGMLTNDETTLLPLAWAGEEAGYLIHVVATFSNSSTPSAESATSEVLRTLKPVICNNIADYPDTAILKHEALARGYQSVAVFPLNPENNFRGVMGLYAVEADFFDEEEVVLLTELADDINYALGNLLKQDQLDYLMLYDPLTGLLNRNSFLMNLESILKNTETDDYPVTMLLCNINQYRYINNMYGMDASDQLLREISKRLKTLTDTPSQIARTGENKIALIFRQNKQATANRYAEALPGILSMPFSINGTEIPITLTAGLSTFPTDTRNPDELYQCAEIALDHAADSGGTYQLFDPDMNVALLQSRQLQKDLGLALQNNQFVLHYQPKMDLVSGRMIGAEALIRWNHPQLGLLPPANFIHLLERSGQIMDVDKHTLSRAIEDWQDWESKMTAAPRIALNVSSIQLQQADFIAQIEQAINTNDKLVLLDLKITEHQLMYDIEDAINKLAEIRKMGVGIIIDDFGTGYSSFRYIARLPANALKIDRSFIATMTEQPESMTIVSTIITLAHSLNLKVIAEGVETEEQARYLRLLRCDEMLGYLYSKPLSATEIPALQQSQH